MLFYYFVVRKSCKLFRVETTNFVIFAINPYVGFPLLILLVPTDPLIARRVPFSETYIPFVLLRSTQSKVSSQVVELILINVINLVASLAKREYYARPELTPKEAFTETLKKINDVVSQFFKDRGGNVSC